MQRRQGVSSFDFCCCGNILTSNLGEKALILPYNSKSQPIIAGKLKWQVFERVMTSHD